MIKKVIDFIKIKSRLPYTKKKELIRGVGAYVDGARVLLYYVPVGQINKYHIAFSSDGFNFEQLQKDLQIVTPKNIFLSYSAYYSFNIIQNSPDSDFLLLFQSKLDDVVDLFTATSSDAVNWKFDNHISHITEAGAIVPHYRFENQSVMYYGEKQIHLSLSFNNHKWLTLGRPVLESRSNGFDHGDLYIENTFLTDKGILVLYHSKTVHGAFNRYLIGAALFDPADPSKLLWRSSKPLWDSSYEWRGKNVSPVGVVLFREKLISYWDVEGEGVYGVVYSFYKLHFPQKTTNISLQLQRTPQNPIIAPKKHNDWESFNTFNPATIFEGDTLHILYRAQGYDYVSSLGYATSKDGISINSRSNHPVFTSQHAIPRQYPHIYPNDDSFSSGGGYGGCEDPRLTKLNDRIYMTYVANDGWLPRLAITSISVENFLNQRWLWEKPVLISPPGIIDKSGCILPEKIKGKYVIFHRIFPNILIDFVDSLEFDGNTWLKGQYSIKIRPDKWDSRKIGAGAPPLKTKDGWLLIYYGVDDKDASKYKIGAMLLDLKDPTKVLHRTDAPILEPDHPMENEGFKPGIAYPCGAVIIGETLFVYYGSADSVVCVATANLNHFLSELKFSDFAKLEQAVIKKVL